MESARLTRRLHVAAERSGRLAWRALEWGAVSVVSAALNSSRLLVAASCLLWHEGVLRRRARLPAFCSRKLAAACFPSKNASSERATRLPR